MTVIVAGAGPTGLTLACELARRGVRCRVFDKARGLFPGSRGKGLSPRTQEVFDDLGVRDAMRAGGMPFPPFRLYSGRDIVSERTITEMLGTPMPSGPDVPYPDIWLVPQWRTDEILRARLVELGGSVEFGAEVTGFDQDAGGVTVTVAHDGGERRVRADYLVGADGGRSAVRKLLGVGFAGESFETERTLIGDVRADGLDGIHCHILTRSGEITERFSLWNLPDSPYYQFVATMPTEQVPPLTLDVQDAYNLGWKLAAVLAGAPRGLLDTYETERMPVAAHVLGLSTEMHHRDFRPSSTPALAIHQLDLTYRDGPLATDDRAEPGLLRAGDRAPDAPLEDGRRLFDVFRGPHFTLLAFGPGPISPPPGVVIHRMPKPPDGYDLPDAALVLVRPDGHIGVITESPQTVRRYLDRVSPPSPT